jgi:uncharacterized repeat protein (TIGR02543 family)
MKKRDSMNKKLLCVGAICSLISLFTACEALGPEPEPVTVSYEKAVAHIQIGNGVPGRTVRPNATPEDVSVWKLLGGKLGDTETPLLEFTDVADAAIALEPGEWSFTIKGYKDSDGSGLILSGTIAARTISLEGAQTLVFEVEPDKNEGTGTVSITINLPASSGVTSVEVFKDGTELETSPIGPVGDTIAFTETSDAGAYYYSFKLYNEEDDKPLGVVSEMVHVGANLTSAKTYTLAQKDLNLTYTIKYHVSVGTMEDGHYQIAVATTLAEPSPRDGGYTFKGWCEQADFSDDAVTRIPVGNTGNKDFYARWMKTFSGYSLADALDLISANAEDGDDYTIILNDDEPIAIEPTELSYGGKKVDITLEGGTEEQILSLSSKGSLFTVESGVTLKLGNNITLEGLDDNTASLVKVNSGGALEMNNDSKIRGNTTSSGGGVSVSGMFTMNGGEISGNTVTGNGGGVQITGGTFIMNDGTINNNTARFGGGVQASGTFTMNNGTISNNIATENGGGASIGGSGTFTMKNGAISGNTAPDGRGVYSYGTYIKEGGVVQA